MVLEELREDIAERIPYIMESADEFGNSPFSLSDLADCIIIEVIKPIFEKTLRISSPRARVIENANCEESEEESEEEVEDAFNKKIDKSRMALGRKIDYAEKYRKLWYDNLISTRGTAPPELLPPPLSTMREKISGRQLNDMQFDEIENLKSLRILKAINSGALASSKNVSIDKFEELFHEYSAFIENLGAAVSDDKTFVYNTFSLYNLRWHYPLELYYQIVCESESIPASDPFLAVLILATDFPIYTERGPLHTDNRFVLHRSGLISRALGVETARWTKEKVERYLVAKCKIFSSFRIDGIRISDYVQKETTVHDWAEFMRNHYPILRETTHFQWTPRRILTFRNLLKKILENSAIENKFSKSPEDN